MDRLWKQTGRERQGATFTDFLLETISPRTGAGSHHRHARHRQASAEAIRESAPHVGATTASMGRRATAGLTILLPRFRFPRSAAACR